MEICNQIICYSRDFWKVGKKNSLKTGRDLQESQAQGMASTATARTLKKDR